MKSLMNVNGLVFWTEDEIRLREMFKQNIIHEFKKALLRENKQWAFFECEGPLLTPRSLINPNYTNDDVWVQDPVGDMELVLRPETTPSSYVYAGHLMKAGEILPPFVVYQSGKSFRREQAQPLKHMRLREFYQLEFQCIYAEGTMNDYHTAVLEPTRKLLAECVGLPTRIVASDRLPSYSEITVDVEVDNGDKWMEICSISRRTDFSHKALFQSKKGSVKKDCFVVEVAIGLDRLVYNWYAKHRPDELNIEQDEEEHETA